MNGAACGSHLQLDADDRLSQFAGKWALLVVRVLGRGPRRFNAFRRDVGEIGQKVLTSTLEDLEESGLVSRTVAPTEPSQVEHALTELGREFLVRCGCSLNGAPPTRRIEAVRSA